VTLPGPPGALLAAALLGFALETAVVGECVRALAGRWVALWRGVDPIERFVLDLALGGAVVYGVAAVPLGLFGVPLLAGLPVIAAAGLAALWVRRRSVARAAIGRLASQLLRPAPLLVLATGLSVFAVELAPALGAATGNTFDSSLLTTYTALLIGHGSIPLSFHPYADPMILYPQGTTVWLGAAQLLLGLPAARTSVLVTPFFLALPPLSGFVLGRRMFGTDRGGVAVALVLGWLGPSTRSLVGGSNDFAVAFPFVLLVAAQSTVWMRDELPGWGDAVGFGVLVGYTAAINPVGAEWLIPAVLGIGLVGARRAVGDAVRWAGRWGAAVAASIVPVIPSLYVLVRGLGSPGYVPGAAGPPSPTPTGITWSQWVGSVDPFLFRPGDVALSPVPTLRAEIAVLLVLSAAALVLASGGSPLGAYLHRFRTWSLIAFASLVLWLLVLVAARSGVPGAVSVAPLSSGA